MMVESEKTGIFYVDPSMVDMIPISDIKPYKRNAKKHPQDQIEQIINSINAFGMNDPIGVWGEDNVIVEGHGRYLALREMGESGLVPVIHLDNLTDEQRKAYALAHNKLTMNTDFDEGALSLEMEDLSDFFDMSDFGFDAEEEEDHAPAEIVEDEAPELDEVEPVCKRGQVWVLGAHRLMCGDSTNRSEADKLLGGGKI
jgi:site-specific DNA-methyltransferase (adenine-specific)